MKLWRVNLLSPLSKILERLVFNKVKTLFYQNYGIGQHGFRKSASTTTALIDIMNTVMKCYDETSTSVIAVISFDLSQAFDVVDHELLIKRLQRCGFPSAFVNWLVSYLTKRTSQVRLRGVSSRRFSVNRGVPQGSVLGPPLFCVYTNDYIPKFSQTKLVKYADDVNLIMSFSSSSQDLVNKAVTDELLHLENWCSKRKLQLNRSKSKILVHSRRKLFAMPTFPIPLCENMVVLGVDINTDLNWKTHVEKVCIKANQRFHLLRKLRSYLSPPELHETYLTLIRSLLEYACPVFFGINKKLNKKLERIDRRAHNIIYPFCDPFPCKCEKSAIKIRRQEISKRLFKRIQKDDNHLLQAEMPKILPNTRRFQMTHCRTLRFQSSFIPGVTALLNDF